MVNEGFKPPAPLGRRAAGSRCCSCRRAAHSRQAVHHGPLDSDHALALGVELELVAEVAERQIETIAANRGSDSFLMKLRRRCGLVSRGNQGHAVFSHLGVVAAWVLRGWSVERGRQHRHHDPRDECEQFVPIMWRGFGPGPQSISSPFGGLADRRAARRADAPGETLSLRGGSLRAAHLRRTLQRQHPQALGASHCSARSDCPLFGAYPWRSAGGGFRTPLEHTGQQRHPVARNRWCVAPRAGRRASVPAVGTSQVRRRNRRCGQCIHRPVVRCRGP